MRRRGKAGDRLPFRGEKLKCPRGQTAAPYYGGAAVKAGSGSGEGRTRLTREAQSSIEAGSGRRPDRRQDAGFRPMNAERSGAIRTRGARAAPERAGPERTAGTPKGSLK